MADVIEELVAQRQQMHSMRSQMQQGMMQHMGEHMAPGMGDSAGRGMMECPMMQAMGSGDGDHESHHPGAGTAPETREHGSEQSSAHQH
jgi:hypothetical protein